MYIFVKTPFLFSAGYSRNMNFASASTLITDMVNQMDAYNLAKNLPVIHSAIPSTSLKSFHFKPAVAVM